jgi:ATP-dependent protease ClpP protease subunit
MSTAKIFISGRITKGETLVDVIRQFKSFEDPTEVVVEINSIGGNKTEGDAIYDYLTNLDLPVTTKTSKAYSIAAKIFAAGDERIVEDAEDAVMIHFARAKTEGTAEELEEIAAELREIENEFIEFYSEHLSIDSETVRNLLDSETFVSGEEAVELGFATKVAQPVEVVAELLLDPKMEKTPKKVEMKKKSLLKKLTEAISAALIEVVSELTLQDSTGTEIVFPDLEAGDVPKVGDKAEIDNKSIEDGSYIMPSLEDSTVVFEGGKITEIKPEETEKEETTAQKKKKAKTEVKAEEIKEVVTWSVQAASTSFEEGEVLMLEHWDPDGEPYTAGPGEWKLQNGNSIVTDATGVIVAVKEAGSSEQVVEKESEAEAEKEKEKEAAEVEAAFNDTIEKLTKKVVEEVTAEFKTKLDKKDEEITSLKSKIGSKEFKAEERPFEDKRKVAKGESKAAAIIAAARKL